MDILSKFLFDDTDDPVTILWENGKPLYRASDVATKLGLANVRTSIADFDESEKCLCKCATSGGNQKVTFLTEMGLYRLVFASRKKNALLLQKWMINVVIQLSHTGKYEMQSMKKELQRCKKQMQMSKHDSLIQAYDKKYIVYFGKVREIEGKKLIKIGSTKDIRGTSRRHVKDFGEFTFFHVMECGTNEKYERHLQNVGLIRKHLYRKRCKAEGGTSFEVFLMTDDEIEVAVEYSKKNLVKFNDAAPDVQTLNGVIQDMNANINGNVESVDKVDGKMDELHLKLDRFVQSSELILQQVHSMGEKIAAFGVPGVVRDSVAKVPQQPEVPSALPEPTHKKVKFIRGKKIQRYTPDGKQLLQTYESIICVKRDEDTLGSASNSALKDAIRENAVYRGFRWAFLNRELPDDTLQKLPETSDRVAVKMGMIAMLDLDKTKIVQVFADQKAAAAARNFKSGAAISKAVRQESMSSGHYFKLWRECDQTLQEAYLTDHDLPSPRVKRKSRQIVSTNPQGATKTYVSVDSVLKEFHVSRLTLFNAIENDTELKGHRWKFLA